MGFRTSKCRVVPELVWCSLVTVSALAACAENRTSLVVYRDRLAAVPKPSGSVEVFVLDEPASIARLPEELRPTVEGNQTVRLPDTGSDDTRALMLAEANYRRLPEERELRELAAHSRGNVVVLERRRGLPVRALVLAVPVLTPRQLRPVASQDGCEAKGYRRLGDEPFTWDLTGTQRPHDAYRTPSELRFSLARMSCVCAEFTVSEAGDWGATEAVVTSDERTRRYYRVGDKRAFAIAELECVGEARDLKLSLISARGWTDGPHSAAPTHPYGTGFVRLYSRPIGAEELAARAAADQKAKEREALRLQAARAHQTKQQQVCAGCLELLSTCADETVGGFQSGGVSYRQTQAASPYRCPAVQRCFERAGLPVRDHCD